MRKQCKANSESVGTIPVIYATRIQLSTRSQLPTGAEKRTRLCLRRLGTGNKLDKYSLPYNTRDREEPTALGARGDKPRNELNQIK